MARLSANPCRRCLQNPVITIDNEARSCSVRCTHCDVEVESSDEGILFDFDKNMIKSEAIRLWNDKYGKF